MGGTFTWSGALFDYFADNNSYAKYDTYLNGMIQCGLGYQYGTGDFQCFNNDEFFWKTRASLWQFDMGFVCVGGEGQFLNSSGYFWKDQCFVGDVGWDIIPDPSYPSYYMWYFPASYPNSSSYINYKRGHSCSTWQANKTVCLGGKSQYSDYFIVNGDITNRRVSPPDIWWWSCVSPNEASIHNGQSYDKTVYCVGGVNYTTFSTTDRIWYYDPDADIFGESSTRLPYPMYFTSCAPAFNGKIYCFGGGNNKILELSPVAPVVTCRPCDYGQLNPNSVVQYFFKLPCLFINLIACNGILFAMVFIAILILGGYISLRKRGAV